MTLTASLADRLGLGVAARRLNYHTGMLLDAEDLRSEQTYHRSRLARALATLHGHGTIAGLAVGTQDHDGELHITISPGLAIDRLGRLIELAETHCLRLDRWLEEIRLGPNGRTELEDAFSTGALTADVFIAYSECEQGLRPALPQANVDALDAAVPGMLAESGRCELVLRQEPEPELHLPRSLVDELGAEAGSDPADAQNRLAARKLGEAWRHDLPGEGLDAGLPHDPEHVLGQHQGHELFLARLRIPYAFPADRDPHREAGAIDSDNVSRRFCYSAAELAWLAGLTR